MKFLFTVFFISLSFLAISGPIIKADIEELDDFDYPDNPDLHTRSSYKGEFSHSEVHFEKQKDLTFNITILPKNGSSDNIVLDNIKLLEWIPTIPDHIKGDKYMEKLCIINQEWNRQQVKFKENQFRVEGENLEHEVTTRVDFARNCLNSYLWEIITYTTEKGSYKPIYHGWFTFPKKLYADLYKIKNDQSFSTYADHLVDWKDPENAPFDLEILGERKKKEFNIIYPTEYTKIRDFLTDSTKYATFSPPGFYNREDPRTTELGRFWTINDVKLRETKSTINGKDGTDYELVFDFTDKTEERKTEIVLGGLDFSKYPKLEPKDVNKGYMIPMGVSNHSFYEDYYTALKNPVNKNPYFGVIRDDEGNFLDSHKVGIDGPLFHFDKNDPTLLHVWFLSFERHSLVGHYELKLPKDVIPN